MSDYSIGFIFGFIAGTVVFAWVGWNVHRRMIERLFKQIGADEDFEALQTRRDAIDYNIDQVTPEGAGPAGEMSSLFEIHPGAMTLSHIAKTKSAEKVDPQ